MKDGVPSLGYTDAFASESRDWRWAKLSQAVAPVGKCWDWGWKISDWAAAPNGIRKTQGWKWVW